MLFSVFLRRIALCHQLMSNQIYGANVAVVLVATTMAVRMASLSVLGRVVARLVNVGEDETSILAVVSCAILGS